VSSAQVDAGRSRDDLVEERKAVVLDTAEQLLAVHGFDALRLRDVAKAAGVSIGLIQHYFTTRDELLRETMRTASQRRARQWTPLANGHERAPEKLTALLEGALNDRHRCVVWLETCAAASRHPELVPDVQRTQEAWRAAMRAAIQAGVADKDFKPTIPAEDIVALLVSLIDGLMLATATEPSDPAEQERRVQLLREAAQRLLGLGEERGAELA
jgi:TetR/AcrR family transcriptional repressor of bet genes